MKQLDIDGMPPEVALENILRPTQNTSSSFLRACHRARWKYFVSEQQPKSEQQRLSSRMKRTPIDRLVRELRRGQRRLKICESIFNRLGKAELKLQQEQFFQVKMVPLINRAWAARNELERRGKEIIALEAYKKLKSETKGISISLDEIKQAEIIINQINSTK